MVICREKLSCTKKSFLELPKVFKGVLKEGFGKQHLTIGLAEFSSKFCTATSLGRLFSNTSEKINGEHICMKSTDQRQVNLKEFVRIWKS